MIRLTSLSLTTLGALVVPLLASSGACSSAATANDAGDELGPAFPDVYDDGPSSCPPGVKAGTHCTPIAPDKIFCAPTCEGGTGGCRCVDDKAIGEGIWSCQPDNCGVTCAPMSDACVLEGSTFADTGPLPDTFVLPDTGVDAGPGDGGPTDGSAEASKPDAGDAKTSG